MRFSQWLHESDNMTPDAKGISYTACVLHRNSQDYILSQVEKWMVEATGHGIPTGWTRRAHHMTVKFKPNQTDIATVMPFMGEEVILTVTNWAFDDYGIALVVKPDKNLPIKQIPHVTVAHARSVGAVYSNTLLTDKSKWRPASAELTSYMLGVNNDQISVTPPMGGLLLARPSV